jgi:hypothetical protein
LQEIHNYWQVFFNYLLKCKLIYLTVKNIPDKEGDEIEWSVESFGYNSSPFFNVASWMETEFVNGDKIKMLIVTDLVHTMDSSTSAIAVKTRLHIF